MSIPRKHHYLPQFYLERFRMLPQKGNKPHIWQIEKKNPQIYYDSSIGNTGCIRDYHSLDYHDQEPDHEIIEQMLSKVESGQAKLIESIVTSKSIDKSQILGLSEFISMIRFRIPSFAAHVEISHKKVAMDSIKILYQSGKLPPPPKVLKEAIESKGIDSALNVKISNWKIVEQMLNVGTSPTSINLLAGLKYQIYHAVEPSYFVTSDNPVALFHPNYDEMKPYGVGIAIKGVELTLPLSSNVLVRAGHNLKPGSYLASSEQVSEFNRRTIIMSESYVFSNRVNEKLKSKINLLKDIFAGFTYDNLYHGDGSIHISRFIPVHNC